LRRDLHGLLAGGHGVERVPVRRDYADAEVGVGEAGQAPVTVLGLHVRPHGPLEIAGRLTQTGRISGQHVHPYMHELLPFRDFFAVRYSRPPANQPRPAFARRRRSSRGCVIVIGAVVRSAALMSVLPGRQERRFVVTTVGVNPCHFVTRQVTVCHSLLWLGPRSAPGNSSQALSRRRDKIIFYRMRACVTRMECRFCIRIEFKYPGACHQGGRARPALRLLARHPGRAPSR
jgi:hypothetical protein